MCLVFRFLRLVKSVLGQFQLGKVVRFFFFVFVLCDRLSFESAPSKMGFKDLFCSSALLITPL